MPKRKLTKSVSKVKARDPNFLMAVKRNAGAMADKREKRGARRKEAVNPCDLCFNQSHEDDPAWIGCSSCPYNHQDEKENDDNE